MAVTNHIWNFSTVGGVKRVNLESANDLKNLNQLDQKLWTALSCPVQGLEIDPKTLTLIDGNGDGQINVPDVLEAVEWILKLINNPNSILNPEDKFPLSLINTEDEEGARLYASAKVILQHIGHSDDQFLTVEQTSDTEKIFAGSPFNGDGIITEDSADNEDLKNIINYIVANIGSAKDRGGKLGISSSHIETFMADCQNYSEWVSKCETNTKIIKPLDEHTANAFAVYQQLKLKIDDYFLRCNLANYDESTEHVLNISTSKVESISPLNLSQSIEQIAIFPISKVNKRNIINLNEGVNPAWFSIVETFVDLVAKPVFSTTKSINQEQWQSLESYFAPYAEWMSQKTGLSVESLGIEKVRSILSENCIDKLNDLIAQDIAVENEANSIINVDKMLRYYFDIFKLLQNFVTFYDFYSPRKKAIFQNGTLYIDQRSCDLTMTVNDMGRHNMMVSFSGMYLLYCDCTLSGGNEKRQIVAALTDGDVDNLVVGRNALYYDRQGRAWKATITKIVENPISIRQAFWAPYRKVQRLIENQINKFAADQESKSDATMASKVVSTQDKIVNDASAIKDPNAIVAPPPPKAPPTPFDIGKFVGIFAAISLALGALGTVLASLVGGFVELKWWQMPLALLGVMLSISGPSMLIAFLKLRKRNLAPLLDANGWAINARATVNIVFGKTLTQLATLPPNSKINVQDPFSKKKTPFWVYLLILLAAFSFVAYFLHRFGYIHLPPLFK